MVKNVVSVVPERPCKSEGSIHKFLEGVGWGAIITEDVIVGGYVVDPLGGW
jgi:hypothetical protein